ncbi:tryptophan synthase subunit alpha [soil metagenome]
MASASAIISSNALALSFARLRAAGRPALVAYVTAGYPTLPESRELIRSLPDAGADVIEIGVPFSDPMADGPTIQASSQRALENGMTLLGALALVADAAPPAPTVLFTYLNPLLAAGPDVLERVVAADVSGILVTDLPLGADPEREAWISGSGLAFVRLVAPTTPPDRIAAITRHGGGFVYVISRLGVTGARADISSSVRETVLRVRSATNLPVCFGFGVSTPSYARDLRKLPDWIVVGSVLVEAAGRGVREALSLTAALREALDD